MSPIPDAKLLKTDTWFLRAVLIISLPMCVLCIATVPVSIWEKASYFLQHGDATRYWLNRGTAILAALFFISWFGVNIHLLTKKVFVTPAGFELRGIVKSSVRWEEIASATIERGKYTVDLVLVSRSGRRHEICIGNRETAAICRTVLAEVSRLNPTATPRSPTGNSVARLGASEP